MIHPLSGQLTANCIGFFDFGHRQFITPNAGNNAADIGSRHNEGSTALDVMSGTPILYGAHATFDGVNDFLDTTDATIIAKGVEDDDFYFVCVLRQHALEGATVCGWQSSAGSAKTGMVLSSNGTNYLHRIDDAAVVPTATPSTATRNTNEWNVIGMGQASGGASQKLYINGALESLTDADTRTTTTFDEFRIGGFQAGSQFDGDVRLVLIFDALPTDDQIHDVGEWVMANYVWPKANIVQDAYINVWEFETVAEPVAHKTDISGPLQRACNYMMHHGGEVLIPGGFYYVGDQVDIGYTSGQQDVGGCIRGMGAGQEPKGGDVGEKCSGQTVLYSTINDTGGEGLATHKSVLNVRTYGTAIRDIIFQNAHASNSLGAFIAMDDVASLETGRLQLDNVRFDGTNSFDGMRAIWGRGQNSHEDECVFRNCWFLHLDYAFENNDQQSVGYRFDTCSFQDVEVICNVIAGGKIYITGAYFTGNGIIIFDLRSDANQGTSRNSGIFGVRDSHTDAGSGCSDVVICRNTNNLEAVKTPQVFLRIDNFLAMQADQTVEFIDLEDCEARVVVTGGTFAPETGVAFAHIQDETLLADENATANLVMLGTHLYTGEGPLSATSRCNLYTMGVSKEGQPDWPDESPVGSSKYPTDVGI